VHAWPSPLTTRCGGDSTPSGYEPVLALLLERVGVPFLLASAAVSGWTGAGASLPRILPRGVPHWTGATPRLRRQLLLRTHEWIADRLLAPEVSLPAAIADLHPHGALARALTELVPPDEIEGWLQFIRLVVATLRHALRQPVTQRNEAWVRWLFLIPYAIRPTPATRAAARASATR
jgi:hypothetical protein